MKARCLASLGLALALLVGCSKSHGLIDPGAKASIAPGSLPDYMREERSNGFGKMERFSLSAGRLEQKRQALSQQELRVLSLPKDYGTTIYRVDGYEEPAAVLLRPRILLESSLSGERTRIQEKGPDEVVLSLAVAFVDGLQTEIATGTGSRKVPESFLVKSRPEFLAALQSALGRSPIFISSIPCPERVWLRAKGIGEFPVEVRSELKTCPINSFFPAQITLKKSEWETIALSFLESGSIEVLSEFNLSTPLTVDYADLHILRSALAEMLASRIKVARGPLAPSETAAVLDECVGALQKAFGTSFPSAAFSEFEGGLARDYFSELHQPNCPGNLSTCYAWKGKDLQFPEPEIEVRVSRQDYYGKPIKFQTESTVTDALSYHQPFLLDEHSESVLAPPPGGTDDPLFLTIREGEVVEFRIDRLNIGMVDFSAPQIQPITHLVCVDPYQVCQQGLWRCTNPNTENFNCKQSCTGGIRTTCAQSRSVCTARECDCSRCRSNSDPFEIESLSICHCTASRDECVSWQSQCQGFGQVCDQRRVCDRLPVPTLPQLPYRVSVVSPSAPDFAWDCLKLTQDNCDADKWEDHWERVTTWSLPTLTPTVDSRELRSEDWSAVVPGLSLHFSWAESSGMKQLICPVTDLEYRILPPNRLLVSFKNGEKCAPFNAQNQTPGFEPTLSILNQIVLPSQFQCGHLWESWEGKRKYTCQLPDGRSIEKESTRSDDDQALSRGESLGIHQPYFPRVELQGSLRIVGSYFESGEGPQ